MADEDERIEVIAILRDELSRPAERAADKIEDLGDAAEDTEGDLEKMGDQADDTAKQVDDLTDSVDDNTEAIKKNTHYQKQNRDERGRFTKSTEQSTKATDNNTRAFGAFLKIGFKVSRLFKLFKWGLMIDGALMLGGALTGLGAAAYAAVAGLAPLSGVLVAYPGMLMAGLQGMVAFKLGAKGMGEALKVLNDPTATAEQLNEALAGMSRNQVLFVRALADTTDETEKLRKIVSREMFADLHKTVDELVKDYFPILNEQLGETGDALNDIAKYTADWLDNKSTMQTVERIMSNNNVVIERMGKGLSSFTRGFLWVLRAAGPMLKDMAADFESMGESFAVWTRNNGRKMHKFFTNSYDQLKAVLDVIGDFAVGLFNIGKEADVMSDFLGDSFTEMGEDFRKWTESTEGKKSIRQFFEDMVPVVEEIGLWVRDIVEMLGGIALGPEFLTMSQELRTNTLPLLGEFLSKSAGKFLPLLNDLLRLLNKMADAGLLDSLANVIDGTIGFIDILVDGLEALPDPLQEFVSSILAVMAAMRFGGFLVGGGRGRGKGGRGPWGVGRGNKPGRGPAADGKPGKHRSGGLPKGPKPKGRSAVVAALLAGGAGVSLFADDPGVAKSRGELLRGQTQGRERAKNMALTGAGFGSFGGAPGAAVGLVVGGGIGGIMRGDDSSAGYAKRALEAGDVKAMKAAYEELNAEHMMYIEKLGPDVVATDKRIQSEKELMVDLMRAVSNSTITVDDVLKDYQDTAGGTAKTLRGPMKGALKDTERGARGAGQMFRDMAGHIKDVPDSKTTRVSTPGLDDATNKILTFSENWNRLNSKTLNLHVTNTGARMDRMLDRFGGPHLYAGGETSGKTYLTGEMGPELWMSRTGAMKMLGLNGPEFAKLGPGAVLPASATADPFGGETGNAPDWAVDSLRKAAKGSLGGSVNQGGSKPSEGHTGPLVHIDQINAYTEMDVEAAVLRAIRKAEREKAERK